MAAARKARSHGVRTILNAAPARPFPDGLKGLVDILVVNEIEAEAMRAALADQLSTDVEPAMSLLQFAPATLVTAGPAGVSIATRIGLGERIAGHTVDLVSTHGAGDCFVGSLAVQLARGADIVEAARHANARAALHVSSPAGSDPTGDQAKIRALLRRDAAR